ncbi:uncharacterized protein [Coffea arabica]|uniref:J domain-containing protein n=1 Tax=Coffea arabica TaxID=13443 RepID=A0A6P6X546_COFAR
MMSRIEEYNRELEALRVKEKVENMIHNEDYAGARDTLQRARNLFPLGEIVPKQTVCEILSAANINFPGCEIDYYWVLQLVPSAKTFDIKHQYQKLRNMLQPLKHNFPGTDVALKLIEDAFFVLSDNQKRSEFNLQRSTAWENYESPPLEATISSELSEMKGGMSALASGDCQNVSLENLGTRSQDCLTTGMHLMRNGGAWSNSTSNTSEGDMAEVMLDVNTLSEQNHAVSRDHPSSSRNMAHEVLYQDIYNFDDDREVDNMAIGQIWATHYQSNEHQNRRYAQIIARSMSTVTVMWLKPIPVTNAERRWCEAGLPVGCGSFRLDLESGEQVIAPLQFSYKCSLTTEVAAQQFDMYPQKGEVWAVYEDWNLEEWSYNPEVTNSCNYRLVEILSDFSTYTGFDCTYLVKVPGFRSIFQRETGGGISITVRVLPRMLYSLSHKVLAYRLTGEEIDGVVSGMLEVDQLALPNNMRGKPDEAEMWKMEESGGKADDDAIMSERKSPNLSSLTGQVWAVYCGRDKMPRQYVVIHNVFSRTQVLVKFLEPEPEPEPEPDLDNNWRQKSLPIACGAFSVGDVIMGMKISQLSHLVKVGKTMPGYVIYPAKGEIWAMYQRWNCEWKLSDLESCEYWIVEVLSDFSEREKIVVARLGEVKGCFTFFQRLQLDGFEMICEISRAEIHSFSHRIPFCKVPGVGDYGISESSLHLEPNCLPPKRRKLA